MMLEGTKTMFHEIGVEGVGGVEDFDSLEVSGGGSC